MTGPPGLRHGRLLRGGNVHHRTTVFSQRVRAGALSALHAADVGADFATRFIERFGGDCQPAATRAALQSVPGPTLTEALLEGILAIERRVARAVGRLDRPRFSRIVPANGEVELVWDSDSSTTSRAVARAAFAGLIELVPADLLGDVALGRDFDTRIAKLLRRAQRQQWSPATAVLALAAKQRGLQHEVLAGNYLRLGAGVAQQIVSESALGVFPRPEHGAGRVKPTRASRAAAGQQLHRLLLVDGRLVSALRCDAPAIIGDGTSSIRQLIHRLNDDPQRDGIALHRIRLDARLRSGLARLDFELDDVLPLDQRLALPGVETIERGAIAVDVTEQVHQSVRETAELAARDQLRPVIGLEFATVDITRSQRQPRVRVLATSPSTELCLHALCCDGETNRVAGAALDLVFPADTAARIPTVLLVGERGTRSILLGLDRRLRTSYEGVGMALKGETAIHGQPVDPTSIGRHSGPEFVLGDPRVDIVIGAASPRRIVKRGLQLEQFTIVAILDPEPGSDLEMYRAGVSVSLTGTTDVVVIGADQPYADLILDSLGPARVLIVTERLAHPLAARHLAGGGAVVLPAPGRHPESIELRRGDDTIASLPVASLLATWTDHSQGRPIAAGPQPKGHRHADEHRLDASSTAIGQRPASLEPPDIQASTPFARIFAGREDVRAGRLRAPLFAAGLAFAIDAARDRHDRAAAAAAPPVEPSATAAARGSATP